MEKLNEIRDYAVYYAEQFIAYLPTLLGALAILVIGWFVIKLIIKWLTRFFDKKDYDKALEKFLISLTNIGLKILLLVLVISQMGVETASLIALLGAAGLAIGLALQGSLSNFAGGVIILALKPFRLGDWIEAQGLSGTVTDISLFYTKLTTFGNQMAIIPNGQISNDNIVNYTVLGIRRGEFVFGISYNNDIELGKKILMELAREQEGVLKDPAPEIMVKALGDNSVNLSLRFFAKNEDYWDCHWYTIEQGKIRLEAAGIEFPFPQRDMHVYYHDDDNGEENGKNKDIP
jgi:small conductance mechanosensitive channel